MSRDKIIDGGVKEFSENGYFRTSMDDIAKRANVAKGTLYYHFKSKSLLFRAILTEGIDSIIREIQSTLDEDIPLKKQIEKLIEGQIRLYLEYKELARLFLNEISNGLDEETLTEVKMLKAKYVTFLANQLEEACRYGYIRNTNFKVTAIGLVGYINSICSAYLDHEDKYSPTELVDSVMQLLSSLIVSEEGKK